MITRRGFLIGLAAVAASAPSYAAPKMRDPAAILADIYRPTRDQEVGAAFGVKPKERRKYLSRELITVWARADRKSNPTGKEAPPIDWDVATNSQGLEVGSYVLKVESEDDKEAHLMVTLTAKTPWTRNSPDEDIVRYHFIRENGRWVIDDIRNADDSAVKGLKGHLIFHATGKWPRA